LHILKINTYAIRKEKKNIACSPASHFVKINYSTLMIWVTSKQII